MLNDCTGHGYAYFCGMTNLQSIVFRRFIWILTVAFFAAVSGCKDIWREESDRKPLARVGVEFLYPDALKGFSSEGLSAEDSIALITDYINSWAKRELLYSKAQLNLPPEKLAEFDALVAEYKMDLYTRAYKEALVAQSADTVISQNELFKFYEEEKENFKLQEKLVQIRFIALPQQFMNRDEITKRLKRFNEDDVKFLDSVGVQFLKLNFNDSLWVPVSRVVQEIPLLDLENEEGYLSKPNYFELNGESSTYLVQVLNVKNINDIAPLRFVEPTIRQVLLNRRRMRFLRKMETDLLNEATERNDFQIYE